MDMKYDANRDRRCQLTLSKDPGILHSLLFRRQAGLCRCNETGHRHSISSQIIIHLKLPDCEHIRSHTGFIINSRHSGMGGGIGSEAGGSGTGATDGPRIGIGRTQTCPRRLWRLQTI